MGTFSVVNINYFQNVHERYLIRLGNSVNNIYYICLVRQIALNGEIDAIIGYFKLRLDLKKSKKISNDQEPIQSDPISCPQNQKGNN